MLYECTVCGYIYNESVEKVLWEALAEDWTCPLCDSGQIYFTKLEEEGGMDSEETKGPEETVSDEEHQKPKSIDYPKSFKRQEDRVEKYMDLIHQMATTGQSIIEPMRSKLKIPSWEDILILGAQLGDTVLDESAHVNTSTVIGKGAKRPMIINHPVFITHMSFGALSREMKLSLARGSAAVKTAMCSGEGGILKESMEASYKYIFEYVPNKYSVTDDNLKKVDAIEIKIGQGTKPGMGGHLPGNKVTEEIAAVRQKPMNQDIISPSRFEEIRSKEDLKALVDELRVRSDGRPIGIKIAAGHIEKDLAVVNYAKPDFVTIDGRGGGTGASPKLIKDATSVPTVFALHRARKYMDAHHMDMELIITGGLRLSSDFAKALALGADAIAIGTGAMIAATCQQYKVCHLGKCPVGCATQDPLLRERLDLDNSAKRVYNYLTVCLEELKTFARITGKDDVHRLSISDLATVDHNISMYTDIPHV